MLDPDKSRNTIALFKKRYIKTIGKLYLFGTQENKYQILSHLLILFHFLPRVFMYKKKKAAILNPIANTASIPRSNAR